MPPMLTYTPRESADPVADELRAHVATLLEPTTYQRLAPADPNVPHPAVTHDEALRRYLEDRNRSDRESRAAMAVAGYPVFGFGVADRSEAVAIEGAA